MLPKIRADEKITRLPRIKVKEKIRLRYTGVYEMLPKVKMGLKITTKVIIKMPLIVRAGKTTAA